MRATAASVVMGVGRRMGRVYEMQRWGLVARTVLFLVTAAGTLGFVASSGGAWQISVRKKRIIKR
jgi:hypothetical protein